MKTYPLLILGLTFVALAARGAFADGVGVGTIVSPMEWKVPTTGELPIAILCQAKNQSDKEVILPIGEPINLEFTDENGKRVGGGESIDSQWPYTDQDYRRILPGWSTYFSAGELSLHLEANGLFIRGRSVRGGWITYGPFFPGKYKLKCRFRSGKIEPSEYAKKNFGAKDLWFGDILTESVDIVVK